MDIFPPRLLSSNFCKLLLLSSDSCLSSACFSIAFHFSKSQGFSNDSWLLHYWSKIFKLYLSTSREQSDFTSSNRELFVLLEIHYLAPQFKDIPFALFSLSDGILQICFNWKNHGLDKTYKCCVMFLYCNISFRSVILWTFSQASRKFTSWLSSFLWA